MSDLLNSASLVLIPSGYKEDVVYSEIPTDGSGDLTFTRASDGTRINSAGLVEVCPWNLAQYSEDFSNGVWANSNITVTTNAISSPNGTTTADKIENNVTSGNHFVRQTLTVISSQVYTLSVYLKAGDKNIITIADGFNTNQLATYNLSTETATNVGGTNASISNVGNGWFRCSVTYTPASTSLGLMLFSGTTYAGTETSGYFYAWGAQANIGSTAKPYFPTTNRQDVPRLTYQNGGGGCPSLLLEKQSTNLVLYSQAFTNTWFTFFGTTTDNQVVSPDGTQNASKVILGASGAVLRQSVSGLTNGQPYTFSCYIKQGSGVTASLQIADVGSTITLTNDWVRYTYTANWNTSNNIVDIELTGANGSYCYIWGAQLEASSYATSYIPTQGSSVTRLADACYKTGISSLIGQTSGTVFVDAYIDKIEARANNILFYLLGAGVDKYVLITNTGGVRYIDYPDSSIVDNSYGLTNGRHKFAIAYANNDFAFYIDGNLIGTDTSGTPSACSEFGFFYYDSGYDFPLKVNEAILSPTRLTNAQLASLTTL